MPLLIELSPREDVLVFNRKRWAEVVADRELAKIPGKIETNRHGQILMSPPPSGAHSSKQSRILRMLDRLMEGGEPIVECPISTADGIRAADVGWFSSDRFQEVEGQLAFERAPEICVEVISPSNTTKEMEEKRALYFDAGAMEFWLCQTDGKMAFFAKGDPAAELPQSPLCADFPAHV